MKQIGIFNFIFVHNSISDSSSNNGELVASGRQAGTAALATAGLALATIAMIAEFIVYSGFSPRVRYNQSPLLENKIMTSR